MLQKKVNGSEGTARIQALSDGIFSIAMTLLVLDIHVPEVKGSESLWTAVSSSWEPHLAFVIGFFTLLVCWINHHYMFDNIARNNGMLLLLNGFKLLVVSFTPFATALLSKYIGTPSQQTAISIYGFNFFMMGSAMTLLWLYASRNGLTKNETAPHLATISRYYIFASALSGCIFIISFFSVYVSLFLFALMFIIFVFPKNMVLQLEKNKWHFQKNHQENPEATADFLQPTVVASE
jgi:uncharacterized membrane protein